jgi:lipoic acid synthetase
VTRDSLEVRWLGRVPYAEGELLQRAFHAGESDVLLLLEHPSVYTLGTQAHDEHVLVDPASVGAELARTDRGGDVTFHGPGQLVAYPIITLPLWRERLADVVAYVRNLERAIIATLAQFDVEATTVRGYTWVGDEKIAAIGVKVARGRARHGVAINVDPDLTMFDHIVPCGITDRGVTSMARLLGRPVEMRAVVDAFVAAFAGQFGYDATDRHDVVWRHRVEDLTPFSRTGQADTAQPVRLLSRRAEAGVVETIEFGARRPEWMRVKANLGADYRATKAIVADLGLTTVCEEAGCPNRSECWADGTATFMINGERCTRACGFCLVDTRHPEPLDPDEPRRVAEAVARLGLAHAVITCVARDDLADGGAGAFANTVAAIRVRNPDTQIELLISDCEGRPSSLATIFASRPDVLNHNLETVARLQRVARPSANYARSLAVLARSKAARLTTKSGLIVGMGETVDEVHAALRDLRTVGVDIVTIGQYLRPTISHLPVARYWNPDEFGVLAEYGRELGFRHVESGPLVRSSYHAKQGATAAAGHEPAAPVALAVGQGG